MTQDKGQDATAAPEAAEKRSPAPADTRLVASYEDRTEVRALGAKWNREKRYWYVPKGEDMGKFANWLPLQPATEDTRLYVDFGDKDEVKARGAQWDKVRKAWFAPKGIDLALFQDWLKERPKEPAEFCNPQEEFASALTAAGLVLNGLPIMDGKWHHCETADGRPGKMGASYKGWLDGRPNGIWENFRSGERGKWLATEQVLTPESRQRLHERFNAILEANNLKRLKEQEEGRMLAQEKWDTGKPVESHPYLERKGVKSFGLRENEYGNLLVPGYDARGRLSTLEFIGADGAKRYQKDCPKAGAMLVLPDMEALNRVQDGGAVFLVEGYATGASVHEATGLPVVVAFDAGNLKAVARTISAKLPNARLTVCADMDAPDIADAKNVGVQRALGAIRDIPEARMVVPVFTPEEQARGLSDFNDLHQSRGLEAVRQCVRGPGIGQGQDKTQENEGMER